MGIQTFDENRLRQMGRLGFGTAETFEDVVRPAHDRGFTVSGDLLFNLPGQRLAEMRDDVSRAIEIGLDHLGLYHLVMFAGLGTEWSRDPSMVAALVPNEVAAKNFLELRGWLLERGFYQATLTNFEKCELQGDEKRFVYEELSFQPDRYDMIGFGPSGISFAGAGQTAVKAINPDGSLAYLDAVNRNGAVWDRRFTYSPRDLRIFHLTRRLAALLIDRDDYFLSFGSDPLEDFPTEFQALEDAQLLRVTSEAIEPTPLGMFYADSIAGLLAWKQIRNQPARRAGVGITREDDVRANENAHGHM
jgi:oxygen-independent coproporphyrinogen-3 oxidase